MKTNRNTSNLIGRSVRTVKRVLAEEKNTGTLRPPKVPQREDLLILEEHQKYLIRRTVHQFFFDNLPPTLNLIHAKIQQNEEIPKMSRSKLYKMLKSLNFT
jgi:transposase